MYQSVSELPVGTRLVDESGILWTVAGDDGVYELVSSQCDDTVSVHEAAHELGSLRLVDTVALVVGGGADAARVVARFLPSNYRVVNVAHANGVVIAGADSAGWTFDGYVQPRLASGLMGAKRLNEGAL